MWEPRLEGGAGEEIYQESCPFLDANRREKVDGL